MKSSPTQHIFEYYLTNAEYQIFENHKEDILGLFEGKAFDLIELGAGDGTKTKVLLNHFLEQGANFHYKPIDISNNALLLLENDLRLPRQSSSQKRNRTALKTIKYLLIIYATTTCFGRLLYGFAIFIKLIIDEESLFGKRKMNVYLWLFEDAIALLGLSNNVVNIFVYIKMIPDFRRFLLTIFSFGRCGREQKKLTDGM